MAPISRRRAGSSLFDAAPGRGTMVRLTMRYDPPGGIVGKGIAKLLQREPHIQARRDLRRFKSLLETGEVRDQRLAVRPQVRNPDRSPDLGESQCAH